MEDWPVWNASLINKGVSFLFMTISYCIIVVSRKDRNDNIKKLRHCCRCQLPPAAAATADAAAVAGDETAPAPDTAAADDEEKQELLMNTSFNDCSCCCCSGGSGRGGGEDNCKLYGAGSDQDPRIQLITKRFRMLAGVAVLLHFVIFMISVIGTSTI